MTLQFQDDSHDVISCRKVPLPGECTQSACPVPMQQCLPIPDLQYINNFFQIWSSSLFFDVLV